VTASNGPLRSLSVPAVLALPRASQGEEQRKERRAQDECARWRSSLTGKRGKSSVSHTSTSQSKSSHSAVKGPSRPVWHRTVTSCLKTARERAARAPFTRKANEQRAWHCELLEQKQRLALNRRKRERNQEAESLAARVVKDAGVDSEEGENRSAT